MKIKYRVRPYTLAYYIPSEIFFTQTNIELKIALFFCLITHVKIALQLN